MSQGITDKERWIGNVNVDNSQVQFLLTILKVLSRNLKKVDCLGASSGEIGKKKQQLDLKDIWLSVLLFAI